MSEAEDKLAEIRWAVSTSGFGCPTVYDRGDLDAAFVQGWRLAMAQVQDVIDNDWESRRHPREVLDDLATRTTRVHRAGHLLNEEPTL